jgi:hypothetical protein
MTLHVDDGLALTLVMGLIGSDFARNQDQFVEAAGVTAVI